ncbi:MAG: hypothetical protein PWQ82_638 [Thermosediminibacterales bacterium]|nr:hypothetical protein [Thermosediminibacterales bacterium]MDK2835860.1 hypothetical protein [Thermosediminibacterales bacterium]
MIEVNPKPNWAVPAHSDQALLESDFARHIYDYCSYLLNINKTVFANPVNSGGLQKLI